MNIDEITEFINRNLNTIGTIGGSKNKNKNTKKKKSNSDSTENKVVYSENDLYNQIINFYKNKGDEDVNEDAFLQGIKDTFYDKYGFEYNLSTIIENIFENLDSLKITDLNLDQLDTIPLPNFIIDNVRKIDLKLGRQIPKINKPRTTILFSRYIFDLKNLNENITFSNYDTFILLIIFEFLKKFIELKESKESKEYVPLLSPPVSIKNHNDILSLDSRDYGKEELLNIYLEKLINGGEFNLERYLNYNDDLSYNNIYDYKKNYYPDGKNKQLVIPYCYGIKWVFETYFNQKYDFNNYWFYNYDRAPLISSINTYKDKFLSKETDECEIKEEILSNYNNETNLQFDNYSHFLFIIPYIEDISFKFVFKDKFESLKIFDTIEPIKSNKYNFQTNLDSILLKNNEDNLIDCKGAEYFGKCKLKMLRDSYDTNVTEFLQIYNQYKNTFLSEQINLEDLIESESEYLESEDSNQEGGNNFYYKYIKYKNKYIKLKNRH